MKDDAVSRLLDEAFPAEHYPVKRKGERRRLNPNRAGIQHLEEMNPQLTDVHDTQDLGEGIRYTFSYGWYGARNKGMYPGPMFNILPLGQSSSHLTAGHNCPDCGNWARTARCETHYELGVDGIMGVDRNGNPVPRPLPRPEGLVQAYQRAIDEMTRAAAPVDFELDTPGERVVHVRQLGDDRPGFSFRAVIEWEGDAPTWL